MTGGLIAASRRLFLAGIVLTAAAIASLPGSAQAQAAFPFKNGDVIRLIVPFGPGGGFDRILRLMASPFEKALNSLAPQGTTVTVIVENMPGAGGRVAYEYLFRAKPDGKQLLIIGDQGAALQQVALGARFKLDEFSYIALVNNSDWGILARKDLGITSMKQFIERAQKTPILFGTSGAGSGDHIASILLQAILKEQGVDMPIEHAHFSSSATVYASMQRGEVEAYIGSVESTLPAVKDKYAEVISIFADKRNSFFPDVKTTTEEQIVAAPRINGAIGISRALVGPPKLPENILATLRKAAEIALNDPELVKIAAAAELPISYAGGDDSKRTVQGHGAILVEFSDLVKSVVK
jgi:tripartite-type tricarboxylate transporter receptor subunit TctC